MIISIDEKFHQLFLIRTLSKVGTYFNIIKATDDIPTTNIILNGEKLKAFSLRSGTRLGCPLSLLLLSDVLEVLASIVRQEEEINDIQIGKRKVKLIICR